MNKKQKGLRPSLTRDQYKFICELRKTKMTLTPRPDLQKELYRVRITPQELVLLSAFNDLTKEIDKTPKQKSKQLQTPAIPKEAKQQLVALQKENAELQTRQAEMETMFSMDKNKGQFQLFKIDTPKRGQSSQRSAVAISLLSDVHYEEVVTLDSTMGLNEYNPAIAKTRVLNYFKNLNKIVTHQKGNYNINHLILGFLGDFIGNWIHPELMQTNAMSPMDAIQECKSVLVSGLKYLNDNLEVDKITVVCVVGNHGRSTPKTQFANMTSTSFEYFMYRDIQNICEMSGFDKLNFIIPEAEMAKIEVLGKSILFTHGAAIKYQGGIGGLAVPLNRWAAQFNKNFKVDLFCLGHFHSSHFFPNAIVNGSTKGYDAYAIGKGLGYEKPKQALVLLDSKYDFCQYTQVHCE